MRKNVIFWFVLCLWQLTACSEYELTPRLSFTAELAPASEIGSDEKVLLLKNFNNAPQDPVSIQGIWADDLQISEFIIEEFPTYLEVRFVLPRSSETRTLEVAASSQALALNIERIIVE